jgi:hypothetical protein
MARRLFNADATPRKPRRDCKFFLLPPEGQDEFLANINANRQSPNVEQLQAIAAAHGVAWAAKNIYEFLKSDRLSEQLIAREVRSNVRFGEELAAAGADRMTSDGRRAAAGHYTTVIREAKFVLLNPEAPAVDKALADKRLADATDKLVSLGALKAGEDKGLIALAKLEIEQEKVRQNDRRIKLLEDRAADAKEKLTAVVARGGLSADTLKQIEEAASLL